VALLHLPHSLVELGLCTYLTSELKGKLLDFPGRLRLYLLAGELQPQNLTAMNLLVLLKSQFALALLFPHVICTRLGSFLAIY
jgi:hypothetical protein